MCRHPTPAGVKTRLVAPSNLEVSDKLQILGTTLLGGEGREWFIDESYQDLVFP